VASFVGTAEPDGDVHLHFRYLAQQDPDAVRERLLASEADVAG
jgi:hypothetical protein